MWNNLRIDDLLGSFTGEMKHAEKACSDLLVQSTILETVPVTVSAPSKPTRDSELHH